MKHLQLEAWTRITSGTAGAVAVRNEGCIPGILLGMKETPVPFKIKAGDMTRILKAGGRNALVDLNLDGQSTFAMIKEFTRNPVSRRIIHVDFQRISATEAVEAAIPLVFVGQLDESLADWTVEHELNTIHVKALPDALPSRIEVDVATLKPHHPFTAGDIVLGEGVTLNADPTQAVAMLVPPKVQEAEEEVAAAPAATEAPAE
ncbi:MAG TPA: 50S ribosomal protein L25 [Armatimonadota bacterium]|jgi:large subunit ribosomal protein L25